MNQYLFRKYDLGNIVPRGSHCGTDKTTVGVPDTYWCKDGRYTLAAFTTSKSDIESKLYRDACDCLDEAKTSIPLDVIDKVILCHTCPRLSPKIDRSVRAIDPRIEIIGPETIAEDLDQKFPILAHLNFGVALGSGAFITDDTFISRQRDAKFATEQQRQLLYRDKDIQEFINRLSESKILIIEGQSGCGKTKLALEGCKKYRAETGSDFLILESRDAGAADNDIELILKGSKSIVVLIDDANRQSELRHLLSACHDMPGIKLVMTVRRLNKDDLARAVETYLPPSLMSLQPLSQEQIDEILKKQYGIGNPTFRERISTITKGNLRLAIMAALSVTDGDAGALEEPYDLLNSYMTSALDDFSGEQIAALEVVSLCKACDMVDGDECFGLLKRLGFAGIQLNELFIKLDVMEIVTRMVSEDGIVAIRMEEQNLRDYLICRYFVKERRQRLSEFLLDQIKRSGKCNEEIVQSLVDVCGSDAVYSYVKQECGIVWRGITEEDSKVKDGFIRVFYPLLPEQSLSYAASEIEARPGADFSADILDGTSSLSDFSTVLSIIRNLMDTEEHREDALELLVECTVKGTESPQCYQSIYGRGGAFSGKSGRERFDIELKKMQRLVQEYQSTKSSNIAVCLIMLRQAYFQCEMTTIASSGESITFYSGVVRQCGELASLQAESIRALVCLMGGEYENWAVETFQTFFVRAERTCEVGDVAHLGKVLEESSNVVPIFFAVDSISSLRCWRCIEGICGQVGIENPVDCSQFSQETKDALALVDTISTWDDVEGGFDFNGWDLARYSKTLEKLCDAASAKVDSWRIGRAACILLKNAAGIMSNEAFDLLVEYIKVGGNTPFPSEALEKLCDSFGRGEVRARVKALSADFDVRKAVDLIDERTLNNSPSKEELERMLEELNDGHFHLRLEAVMKAELASPGYAARYTQSYATQNRVCPDETCEFFFGCRENECLKMVEKVFADNPTFLEALYLESMRHPFSDIGFLVLNSILSIDPTFLKQFVDKVLSTETYNFIANEDIASLWTSEMPFAWSLLRELIDRIMEDPYRSLEMRLLAPRDGSAKNERLFWSRIEEYISTNIANKKKMHNLTYVLSDCDDRIRIRLLTTIIMKDADGNLVGRLWLRRSSMSGSAGEGFTRAMYREIEVIDEVAASLPRGLGFIKYKNWLNEVKEAINREISKEKWDLFHGRF